MASWSGFVHGPQWVRVSAVIHSSCSMLGREELSFRPVEVVATLRSGSVGLVDGTEDCCDGDSKPLNLNNRAALAFIKL